MPTDPQFQEQEPKVQGVAAKPRLRRPHRYRRHRIQPAERRIEISATVSEAVASAFEKKKALPKEGSLVVLTDIAAAGFEPATFGLWDRPSWFWRVLDGSLMRHLML
jgi:hypothetical protein